MSRSIDRLERARPDIADAIDRDALFAQIVADPAGSRAAADQPLGRRRLAIGCIAVAVLCLTAGTAFAVTGFNLFGWHTDTTIVKSPREWQRAVPRRHPQADAASGRSTGRTARCRPTR